MTDDGHTKIPSLITPLSRDSARSVFCTVKYRTYKVSTYKIHTYVQDPGILRKEVCNISQLTIHQAHDHGGRRPPRLLWTMELAVWRCGPLVDIVINNCVAYFDLIP